MSKLENLVESLLKTTSSKEALVEALVSYSKSDPSLTKDLVSAFLADFEKERKKHPDLTDDEFVAYMARRHNKQK